MQIFLQFIILTFMYRSTCFGRPHAHHQELNNCNSSVWFYLRSVVIAVLLVGYNRPDHDQQHYYWSVITDPTTTNSTTITTLRR